MLKVEGTIEDVIFRNDTNGYTVATLKTDDGLVTIVGNAAIINENEMVEVQGDWVYHDTFGEQLQFESIKSVTPSSLKGIENYLSSGILPYIGPKTAENIVDRFGLESLEIIQYNPEKLKEIRGIGQKKLERIVEAFEENREAQDIMVYLQQYDLTMNLAIKIYKKYGSETISIVSKNPYRLSEDLYGIGFKTADEIARKMGIDRESTFRVEAGLKFTLRSSANQGHSYLPKDELLKETRALLGLDMSLIEDALSKLVFSSDFHIVEEDEETLVYSMRLNTAENEVAQKIVALSRTRFKDLGIDVEKEIVEVEEEESIEFGNKQKEAIVEAFKSGVTIITGGPGTGKTTTINAIIEIYENHDKKVLLAAPTGRAAKRMTETSGRESKTIHRLLEFGYIEENAAFYRDEDTPIEGEVIIIDEASMIDIFLMNNLLNAIAIGTRVILVGDIDQLPSVGPGNVLKDIIDSGQINVVELDEIFRQAEESMIVVNAHKINKGDFPILNAKDKDFFFINSQKPEDTLNTVVDLCRNRLTSFYDIDSKNDIQVLTPMKKGNVGTRELNINLQEALNPEAPLKFEKKIGNTIFRTGDKVMQIRNNYNAEWTINTGTKFEEGKGVFNGDIGYIRGISPDDNSLTVVFDDEKEVDYDFKELDELHLAYATTIHKAQGSEFPVVVIPVEWGPPMLLTRNLIYTAITRARELVVLVGNPKYLSMMIANNNIMKRYSSLDKKIKSLIEYLQLMEED